ncbi:MAG: glycosyl hydrolase family 95 catalytic domain-containing protein [Mangrovibacterium sp.]
MKKICILVAIVSLFSCRNQKTELLLHKQYRLWYDKPADSQTDDVSNGWENDPEWLKALPVGNGFLGVMVFGGVNHERIQLNEKTLWSGSPDDNNNLGAAKSLGKIRQLIFDGKYKEADDLTQQTQVCKGVGSNGGNGANAPYGCYQTLGDLRFDFGKTTTYSHYHRELDLNSGLVRVSYEQGGISFTREIFASYPDRVLVMHLSSDKEDALNFDVKMTRPERFETKTDGDNLLMYGTLNNGNGGEGMRYASRLKALATGGSISYMDSLIHVKNATEVLLLLTASTNYKQEYPDYLGVDPLATTLQQLSKAAAKDYTNLLKNHVADYTSLFNKVSLNLSWESEDTIPTDERLKRQGEGIDDLQLQENYFQFGRYLLISSSREGTLPANLQGMWANKVQTPWNCDYHTNINLQMNYWPADVANLSECFVPLEQLIHSLVQPGEQTAKIQYGAGGWCSQTITNVWGYTSPGEGTSWGMYVAGGGWLCHHLWDHYQFTLDREYLKRSWPVMLKSAQFYLDWLVEDPTTGELVSGPSTSPENPFFAPDGSRVSVSMGPSHDQEIISELFANVLEASKILNESDPLLAEINNALPKLAKPQIGSDGRLMEWLKEFKEIEPHHRHVSHLYMLYPGHEIDPVTTPVLADAARKSLDARTDVGTGWSLAWKINFWARLKNGERAYQLLKELLLPCSNYGINMSDAGGTYPNLFCGHSPFQIDGNFGGIAGMAEMLLQSQSGYIDLLPALPKEWAKGEVKGVKARGGFVVGIDWKESKPKQVVVKSVVGGKCVIRSSVALKVNGLSVSSKQAKGAFIILFETEAGKEYHLSSI